MELYDSLNDLYPQTVLRHDFFAGPSIHSRVAEFSQVKAKNPLFRCMSSRMKGHSIPAAVAAILMRFIQTLA